MSRTVESALKTKSSSTVAKRLQSEQFQRWMASGKSVDDVFVLLKLDQEGEKLLANPLFTTFTKFTNTLNQQKPDKQQTTVISVLTKHYGDEVIAKMLGRVPMSKLLTDLETALLQTWVSDKMKPRDAFKSLRLDEAGDSLLSNPLFTLFSKFMDISHAKQPSKLTYRIVRTHYDDAQIARMIIKAEAKPNSAAAAKRMESTLFHEWKSSPDTAFTALRLDKPDNLHPEITLLNDPLFNFWVRFLDDFDKAFPGMTVPRTLWIDTYTSKRYCETGRKRQEESEHARVGQQIGG
ncbi:hypothetical protein DVH05_011143 [Phytophthora capsici]|nr:hypothetical protein DVH05_011143 [Phytophthora capsici]